MPAAVAGPFHSGTTGAGTGVVALWPVALTLGDLAIRLDQPEAARDHYTKALEVAHRVGYRQPAQFAKAFRRHRGVSPSDFRAGGGSLGGQMTARAAA